MLLKNPRSLNLIFLTMWFQALREPRVCITSLNCILPMRLSFLLCPCGCRSAQLYIPARCELYVSFTSKNPAALVPRAPTTTTKHTRSNHLNTTHFPSLYKPIPPHSSHSNPMRAHLAEPGVATRACPSAALKSNERVSSIPRKSSLAVQ